MADLKLRLHYFDIPGKAEATRLLLTVGHVPFEDVLQSFETWKEVKLKMPFGQLPVLEVDGKMLAQSAAIERYAARLGNLYPTDPWVAAQVDEVIAYVQELNELFIASYTIADADAKTKARQEVVAGPLKVKLDKLSSIITEAGSKFLAGSEKVGYADIVVYKYLSSLASGSMDGVPSTILDSYPVIKAFHNRIAMVPEIKARYESITEGPKLAYKVLS